MNKNLRELHDELCPDAPLISVETLNVLLKEMERLRKDQQTSIKPASNQRR